MRVAFAGTPAFAAHALEAIVASGHEVPLVLTQPDRPAGRGMRLTESDVGGAARRHGVAVAKPASLKSEEGLAPLRAAAPEVLVVAAYGLILPKAVLELPRAGCINIHASLLPRWRGAAPIQRALLAGDRQTGISIMRMDEGLDTGPVLLERPLAIGPRDTAGTLTDRLARLGAEAIVEALDGLDRLVPRAQDALQATYAAKIGKPEAAIDWSQRAEDIDRKVRAFNPAPGAEGTVGGIRLKVWEAEPDSRSGVPGALLSVGSDELIVGCGLGSLRLLVVQRSGGRRMTNQEFLRGNPWLQSNS